MSAETAYRIEVLPLDKIRPNPRNPRTYFDQSRIDQLRSSLQSALAEGREYNSPMTVYPIGAGHYQIKYGHRRFHAAQGVVDRLHCRVSERPSSEADEILDQLDDNLNQESLNPIEIATALRDYRNLTGASLAQLAERVATLGLGGKNDKHSKMWVKSYLDLVDHLHPRVQELVASGELSMSAAGELQYLAKPEQAELAQRAVTEGLTSRQLRAIVSGETRQVPEMEPGTSPRPPAAPMLAGLSVDVSRPEIGQRQLDELLAERAARQESESKQRSYTPVDPSHRPGPVTRSYTIPSLPIDLSTVSDHERGKVENDLYALEQEWGRQASDSAKTVARDMIVWGGHSQLEAQELADRVLEEFPEQDELVQMLTVQLRRFLSNGREVLRLDSGVAALLRVYLRQADRIAAGEPYAAGVTH